MNTIRSGLTSLLVLGALGSVYSTPAFSQNPPVLDDSTFQFETSWGSSQPGEIGGIVKYHKTNPSIQFDYDAEEYFLRCPDGLQKFAVLEGKHVHYDLNDNGKFKISRIKTLDDLDSGWNNGYGIPDSIIPQCKQKT